MGIVMKALSPFQGFVHQKLVLCIGTNLPHPTADWDEPSTQDTPWKTQNTESSMDRNTPIFWNIVYSFTFNGGYAIETCIGIDLGLLIEI